MLGEMKTEYQAVETLRPNPWNPNRMDRSQFNAAYHSLRLHGFTTPIVAREADQISPDEAELILKRLGKRAEHLLVSKEEIITAPLEIVDGEHRWVAAQHLYNDIKLKRVEIIKDARPTEAGWVRPDGTRLQQRQIAAAAADSFIKDGQLALPVTNLGRVGEWEAKRLTVVLNETRGEADVVHMADVLSKIREVVDDSHELALELPMSAEEIDKMLDLAPATSFDWDGYMAELDQQMDGASAPEFQKVTFAVSEEANKVWEQAFAEVAEELGLPDSPAARKHALLELARRYLGQ